MRVGGGRVGGYPGPLSIVADLVKAEGELRRASWNPGRVVVVADDASLLRHAHWYITARLEEFSITSLPAPQPPPPERDYGEEY